MREVQHTISQQTAHRLRAFVFPAATIVFAKVGAALLLNRRRLQRCAWLSGLDLGEIANPGAVPSVSEGQMRDMPAAVPPIDEQRAIAVFLDRRTAAIDALIAKVREAMAASASSAPPLSRLR